MAVDDQYTVSLLHFDGGLTDESGKVWTPNYGAATSTVQSKFGGSSLQLNGTTQYLTIPSNSDFNFANYDFTIDWWEYRTALVKGAVFCGKYNSNANYTSDAGLVAGSYDAPSGQVQVWTGNNATSWTVGASLGSAEINVWTHRAFVRSGNVYYGFKDGVLQSTGAFTSTVLACTLPAIGTTLLTSGQAYFSGYIDELRISKGIARWTSDFTPPTVPYSPGVSVNPPTNLTATAGDSQITLSWAAVTGATGYNVKRSTTAGGPYTTVGSNVSGTSYVDSTVTNGTTYYYVVTALNGTAESANSNEASATPKAAVIPPTPTGNVLLRVTMIDSSEREYRLPMSDIDGFVNWINHHVNTDTLSYTLNKIGSNEHLLFDKIISFEVIPLTK